MLGPIPSTDKSRMIWTPSSQICSVVGPPCHIWEVKTPAEAEAPDF
jgi:hypothetical protein